MNLPRRQADEFYAKIEMNIDFGIAILLELMEFNNFNN
jgi:hypothetical protein